MTDARKSKSGSGRREAWPWAMTDLPPALRIQIEVALREQSEFLERTQKLLAAWTKRRCEGMAATCRTFQRLQACQDANDVMTAYGEWLTDGMGRIMADMFEVRDEALRLAAVGPKMMAALASGGLDGAASCEAAGVSGASKPSRRLSADQ